MSAALAEAYLPREAPEVAEARVIFGNIEIDRVGYAVWAHGVQVALTARERRLVVYFAERIGRLVTRGELLSQVWGPTKRNGQFHLNAFLMSVGHHEAAWRLPESDPFANTRLAHFVQLAQTAERGKLDSIFLADSPVLWNKLGRRPGGTLEPQCRG